MRKKHLLLLALVLLSALLLAGCAAKSDELKAEAAEQTGLTIELKTLTDEPSFVDWTQDGTTMQLIALLDKTGAPRLAFNTCQSCGGSPYAWFEYIGDDTLQCQNCGLTFNSETVGTAKAAGCNPVTISDFTVNGDSIVVSEKTLAAAVPLFKNWKVFD